MKSPLNGSNFYFALAFLFIFALLFCHGPFVLSWRGVRPYGISPYDDYRILFVVVVVVVNTQYTSVCYARSCYSTWLIICDLFGYDSERTNCAGTENDDDAVLHLFSFVPASFVRLATFAGRESTWNNIHFNDATKQWKWDDFTE